MLDHAAMLTVTTEKCAQQGCRGLVLELLCRLKPPFPAIYHIILLRSALLCTVVVKEEPYGRAVKKGFEASRTDMAAWGRMGE